MEIAISRATFCSLSCLNLGLIFPSSALMLFGKRLLAILNFNDNNIFMTDVGLMTGSICFFDSLIFLSDWLLMICAKHKVDLCL